MSPLRLGLLTGPLAIVAIIAGLASDTLPGGDVTDAQIASHLDQHGYSVFLTMGGGVGLGGVLLLVFTAVLVSRLEAVGAGPVAVRIAASAGTGWAIMTMLTGVAWISPFVAHVSFTKEPPTASAFESLSGLGYGSLTLFGGMAAALLAATVTSVALRTDLLPRWLAVAGIPASVLILANPMLPMLVIALWFTAVTVALIKRVDSTTPSGQRISVPATA